jgi:hypothetical protein
VKNILQKRDQEEERTSGVEDKAKEILHSDNNKEKKPDKCDYNLSELWETIRRPNIRVCAVEEGPKIQIKGIENIFNEIIA